jgi:hypothetical protein
VTKLSPPEAKDALRNVRETMTIVMGAQKHIQALHLTIDDPTPAYCVEKIASILSALAALELKLRGVAGSGELQRVQQNTPPETPASKVPPPFRPKR